MKIMNYEEFKLELEKELPKASKNELAGLEISFSKLVRTNRMMDGIKITRKEKIEELRSIYSNCMRFIFHIMIFHIHWIQLLSR